jgi:hypothetical protein
MCRSISYGCCPAISAVCRVVFSRLLLTRRVVAAVCIQVGDTIDAKGPMGKFQYEGRGAYQLNRQPGKVRAVGHSKCKHSFLMYASSLVLPCHGDDAC